MTKDLTVRSENKRVQVQHLDSSAGNLREFPLAPKLRKKRFISKEERDEIVKKSTQSVASTHDDRSTFQKGENNLGFFEVKREVLAKKQELLNQSIITNCAASNSRRILNDSIAKGLKSACEVNPDPLHKSDPLRKYVDNCISQGVTNNSIDTSTDTSLQVQAIKTPLKEKKTEKKHIRISLENDKSKNERIRHDKHPTFSSVNKTDTWQDKESSPRSKQRKVNSPKSKQNKRKRRSDDSLNYSRRDSISSVKDKSKLKDFEKQQMQTWVYDILCCQNYYSVGLYLVLLALIIGLIFVAFKLYVSFVLPKDKDTHRSNEINQPNWDKNPNIISDIIPDYNKLIHQVQAGLHSDYNVQKNFSNLELPLPKSHVPTRKHLQTSPSRVSKTNPRPTKKRTTRSSTTVRTTTTTTTTDTTPSTTIKIVKSYKKNLVPTIPSAGSFSLPGENTESDAVRKKNLVSSNYRANNFNYHNLPDNSLYSLTLTTHKPNIVTYPYNRWIGQPAQTTSSSHWKWNGWKWIWQQDGSQYDSNLNSFFGVTSTPSQFRVGQGYDNFFSNSFNPTSKYQQTTSSYQQWWRNYYSSLQSTQKSTVNSPFRLTTKPYPAQNLDLYNSNFNRYQTTKQPTYNHVATNSPYYNLYYPMKSSYLSPNFYNPYYNMYQTTKKSISQQEVSMLSNYQNQLESKLGNFIKTLRDSVDGESSGHFSGDDSDVHIHKNQSSLSDVRHKKHSVNKKKTRHKTKKKKKKLKTTTTGTTTRTSKPTTTSTTPTTSPTTTITTTTTTRTKKASTLRLKTTHKKTSTARWTTFQKTTSNAFSTHDYDKEVDDKHEVDSQNRNPYSSDSNANENDERKNYPNYHEKGLHSDYDNEFPFIHDKVHLADDHGHFDRAFNDIMDSFDSTFKRNDGSNDNEPITKRHHLHWHDDYDNRDEENKPAENEDREEYDDDGDFMTKNKNYRRYSKKKRHKPSYKNGDEDDANRLEKKYQEEDVSSKRPSLKRNRHTYLETIKALQRKSKMEKEKASRDHRLKLLANIQHRIQAIKDRERKKRLRKMRHEEFLEKVGRKRSQIMHLKKKCLRVKQFRPGTHIRIKSGPEKKHGKIIYSIRACRKLLIDDDVRVKCKDIEYRITGGKLTIKGEGKGRLKKYSIYACKKISSEDGDEENSNEGGDEADIEIKSQKAKSRHPKSIGFAELMKMVNDMKDDRKQRGLPELAENDMIDQVQKIIAARRNENNPLSYLDIDTNEGGTLSPAQNLEYPANTVKIPFKSNINPFKDNEDGELNIRPKRHGSSKYQENEEETEAGAEKKQIENEILPLTTRSVQTRTQDVNLIKDELLGDTNLDTVGENNELNQVVDDDSLWNKNNKQFIRPTPPKFIIESPTMVMRTETKMDSLDDLSHSQNSELKNTENSDESTIGNNHIESMYDHTNKEDDNNLPTKEKNRKSLIDKDHGEEDEEIDGDDDKNENQDENENQDDNEKKAEDEKENDDENEDENESENEDENENMFNDRANNGFEKIPMPLLKEGNSQTRMKSEGVQTYFGTTLPTQSSEPKENTKENEIIDESEFKDDGTNIENNDPVSHKRPFLELSKRKEIHSDEEEDRNLQNHFDSTDVFLENRIPNSRGYYESKINMKNTDLTSNDDPSKGIIKEKNRKQQYSLQFQENIDKTDSAERKSPSESRNIKKPLDFKEDNVKDRKYPNGNLFESNGKFKFNVKSESENVYKHPPRYEIYKEMGKNYPVDSDVDLKQSNNEYYSPIKKHDDYSDGDSYLSSDRFKRYRISRNRQGHKTLNDHMNQMSNKEYNNEKSKFDLDDNEKSSYSITDDLTRQNSKYSSAQKDGPYSQSDDQNRKIFFPSKKKNEEEIKNDEENEQEDVSSDDEPEEQGYISKDHGSDDHGRSRKWDKGRMPNDKKLDEKRTKDERMDDMRPNYPRPESKVRNERREDEMILDEKATDNSKVTDRRSDEKRTVNRRSGNKITYKLDRNRESERSPYEKDEREPGRRRFRINKPRQARENIQQRKELHKWKNDRGNGDEGEDRDWKDDGIQRIKKHENLREEKRKNEIGSQTNENEKDEEDDRESGQKDFSADSHDYDNSQLEENTKTLNQKNTEREFKRHKNLGHEIDDGYSEWRSHHQTNRQTDEKEEYHGNTDDGSPTNEMLHSSNIGHQVEEEHMKKDVLSQKTHGKNHKKFLPPQDSNQENDDVKFKRTTPSPHRYVGDEVDVPTRFIHRHNIEFIPSTPHPPHRHRSTPQIKRSMYSRTTRSQRHHVSPHHVTHISPTSDHKRHHTTLSHNFRQHSFSPTKRPTGRLSNTNHKTTLSHHHTTHQEKHFSPTKSMHRSFTTHTRRHPTIHHSTQKMITHHKVTEHTRHSPPTTQHKKRLSTIRVHPPTKNHQPTFNMAAILKSIKDIVHEKMKRDNRPKPSPTPNINSLPAPTPYVLPLHDPTKLRVLCFGDSLTAGYYHHGKSFFPYCTPMKQLLAQKTQLQVIAEAKGIVGEMTHKQMTNRLPLVLGNATAQYDWIIILGGTNDILHVKNFADDQEFLNQLENVWQPRITKDIEKLHAISYKYGAHTLLLTVPENSIELWPEYKPLMKMRTKINNSLKRFAYASNGQTVFCDTARRVPRHSLSPAQENALWDDHLHMTPAGYTKMARVISECLEPYLPHRKVG